MRALPKIMEKCGVVGVSSVTKDGVIGHVYKALFAIQHRGQESAGVAIVNEGELRVRKGLGLVADVVTKDVLTNFKGHVGIGHVLYSTTSHATIEGLASGIGLPKTELCLACLTGYPFFKSLKLELLEEYLRR